MFLYIQSKIENSFVLSSENVSTYYSKEECKQKIAKIKEGDEENELGKIFTTGGAKRKFKKDFKQYFKNLKEIKKVKKCLSIKYVKQ